MANGKPRRPRLTPNQEAWRREERRIKQILYRMEKAGFRFSREELLPQRPIKITKQSIERLKATTPAILRGYAKVPEGFKGSIETSKSKRRMTYLTARGSGQGVSASDALQATATGKEQTAKATEARKKKAKARREEQQRVDDFRRQHIADAMSVIIANVEAELTSGPYNDVSEMCLEKFRSLLATKPHMLYNNIQFAADSLIEAAHVMSYASQQEVRVQYGHLFLTLIYGGKVPDKVKKDLINIMPYGTEDYDTAWETESGIEMEKQAKAPSKGGRPKKEITDARKGDLAFLDALGEKATAAPAIEEMNLIKDSLEFYDPAEWEMQTTEEKVTSKTGMMEYTKKKVILVNKTTGEIVDYAERLKQFMPKNKKGADNMKVSGVYNDYRGGKGKK